MSLDFWEWIGRSGSVVCPPILLALLVLAAGPLEKPRAVTSRASVIDAGGLLAFLQRGELALIESHLDGSSKQVLIFSLINAPAERIWDVIMDVEKYPTFMPSMVNIKVVKRQGPQIAYDWELDVPVFNLKGLRAMRGLKPRLIESRGMSGNFSESRERFELYPLDDGKRTLVVFYRALDVASAGMIIKTAIKLEPSMEHGVNLASGFVFMRDIRGFMEKMPAPRASSGEPGVVAPFSRIDVVADAAAIEAVKKLIPFGPLAIIESNADGSLKQVEVFAEVSASRSAFAAVVHAPEKYPEFLKNFASQEVTRESSRKLKLEYELEVPFANLDGVSMMSIEDNGDVEVVAVSGDVTRGRWRWEMLSLAPAKTLLIHYAYTDIRETSFFVKQLVAKQPLFEHGIVVAASTVATIGMKARAEGKR